MTESEGQKKVNEMLGKLSPQDQEKLHRLLADKEATDRLFVHSPGAGPYAPADGQTGRKITRRQHG